MAEKVGLWATLNDPENEKRWWFRYSAAALLVGLAWYLAEAKPWLWWLSAFFVLAAAVYARELALGILGIGLAIAVFSGIAALPIPVAIVLAGALIAYGVMRSRDPDLDTKLPLIGKWFKARREAKQLAEMLKNPFLLALRTAVEAYWQHQPGVSNQFSQETLDRIGGQLVDEGLAIAQSENPAMENRKRLCDAVLEAARLQVLIMPPPPEEDVTGMRGKLGVSGELKARMIEIVQADKDLRGWFDANQWPYETWDEVWNPVLVRYFIVLSRANVLSALRKELGDFPKGRPDWYPLFLQTQCAYYEFEYRERIGMPPSLPEVEGWAGMTSLKYSLFVNCVSEGAQYPDDDWRERCRRIESRED